MRNLLLLGLMLGMGSANAAGWSQVAPALWINRVNPADSNFPRVGAATSNPSELGANFLTSVYVTPGAAFDLAVTCLTLTNAGVLNGSLVASLNTFTFRQTTITDALRTGLQSANDTVTAKTAVGLCSQSSATATGVSVLPVYLQKGQRMALPFPAIGMTFMPGTDAEGRIVPVLSRSQTP
jgi:hypothetical protein